MLESWFLIVGVISWYIVAKPDFAIQHVILARAVGLIRWIPIIESCSRNIVTKTQMAGSGHIIHLKASVLESWFLIVGVINWNIVAKLELAIQQVFIARAVVLVRWIPNIESCSLDIVTST